MEQLTKMISVSAVVDNTILENCNFHELCRACGCDSMQLMTSSTMMLRERTGIMAALTSDVVEESSPAEIMTLLVPTDDEENALSVLARTFRLDIPGRGSIFSESVDCTVEAGINVTASLTPKNPVRMLDSLMGICCIVQRGKGDAIARVALDTGTCVPGLAYGIGTGLRDKLGILRITIPADKEIITVLTSSFDAESILETMIEVGKLDQPGRGFIYMYPIRKGIINTRVRRGTTSQAASVEQIVAAIDEIKGGVAWRSKGMLEGEKKSKRRYLTNLVDATIICDEGRGPDLVAVAMANGAAGATIKKFRQIWAIDNPPQSHTPAREACSMVVGPDQVEPILKALKNGGLFDEKTHGSLFTRSVPKACTYLGKK